MSDDRKKAMTELVIKPWTNELGQTLNPGDEVLFVGTSWKNTRVRLGVFGGVRYADVTRYFYIKDENGNYVKEDDVVIAGKTYQRNKTERVTTREVVAVRVEKVNRGHKYAYVDGKYTKTDEIVYGVSTLPLKRVYKIDTSIKEIYRV